MPDDRVLNFPTGEEKVELTEEQLREQAEKQMAELDATFRKAAEMLSRMGAPFVILSPLGPDISNIYTLSNLGFDLRQLTCFRAAVQMMNPATVNKEHAIDPEGSVQ